MIVQMTGRQIFSEKEKICLQDLIRKYSLHLTSTGTPGAKKIAWASLTEEFNSIETNTQRTESQLKKCWDNLKTRRKASLMQPGINKERMRTAVSSYPHYTVNSLRANNLRAQAISQEIQLRADSYKRSEEREEELHRLKVAEREWLVQAAEEVYLKARLEREHAEELRYNKIKREHTENPLDTH